MKTVLFLVFLTMSGAAYFEYATEQQTAAGIHELEGRWQDEINRLQGRNKQLTDSKSSLLLNISAVEGEISKLNDQLKGGGRTTAAPAAPATGVSGAHTSNEPLGTITTLAGKSFENCRLLKKEADGLTFSHSQGIIKVLYADMPLDEQIRFGADPKSTEKLEAAKLRYQEQLRQAGAPADGQQVAR